MKLLRIALEEASDGKMFKEIEHVFYGRLIDIEELKKAASVESQEQWEIRIPKTEENANSGSIRIRKTTVGDAEPEYILTTKVSAGGGDKIEVPIPTTADNFEQFKILSFAGMRKDRYHFPVEGTDLVWEVDMFLKPEGGYHEWVKIDLEVSDRGAAIPSLPIELKDVITSDYGMRTEAEELQVSALYAHTFITKNVHLK